ncbi:MAG: cobalt-precorrin 5A hydrolase [Dissulfurimicrobium sp.]|uniref:cobalt-precorrin 5A hydrolase n=1 Tax=Dissulfurimicrobium TaxID=1769732 RepID=UPI001EDA8725|nr:cobalt-precorrin 5A hydrolase [Dissulfurimicrobium hydrothermale]UKL13061.1 cobalt-precorrin 5A hydrolase [Dissulfurimicrobium hydrothermale]
MNVAILALTDRTKGLAKRIADDLSKTGRAEVIPEPSPVRETVGRIWTDYDGFVFIMATGIVVRAIAPHLKDKKKDPCVVVVDEVGRFAISLLSGHIGGGNDLARRVAESIGAEAVITTASDILGLAAVDLWAKGLDLAVEDGKALTRVSARLVNKGSVSIYSEVRLPALPPGLVKTDAPDTADIVVSNRIWSFKGPLFLRPRNLVVGIGCNRGTSMEKIAHAVNKTFKINGLSPLSIRNLASIDIKKDEDGLMKYARMLGVDVEFYSKNLLSKIPIRESSMIVMEATGVGGVCEPAAILSAGTKRLLVEKTKWKEVTVAVAEADFTW